MVMIPAQDVKSRVAELEARIKQCGAEKKRLLDYVQGLKDKWIAREISYVDYEQLVNQKRNGKTVAEWFDYYDWYIGECEKILREEKKKEGGRKFKKVFLWGILVFGFVTVIFSVVYFGQDAVLFAPEEIYQEDLNLVFEESGVFDWTPENSGVLDGLKISGSLEGNVKIYIEDILVLDSSNLQASGLTGFTILDNKSTTNSTNKTGGKVNVSLPGQENETTNITLPPVSNETNITFEEKVSESFVKMFEDYCEESCSDLNLEKESYKIRVEIESGRLELNSISYSFIVDEQKEEEVVLEISGRGIEEMSEETIQHAASIGQEVQWTKKIITEKSDLQNIELPEVAFDVKIKPGKEISVKEEGGMKRADLREYSAEEKIEIGYSTPAPTLRFEDKDYGKLVKVNGPSDLTYRGVRINSEISEVVGIGKESLIEVYWVEGEREISSTKSDIDEDGLIDRVEWSSQVSGEENFEVRIKVLNVQSYPRVGGNWVVDFVTLGNSDLIIRTINVTTWSNESENEDLKFLELKCGEEVKEYEWINDEVVVNSYGCDFVGHEKSLVLTQGVHNLEFEFGGEKAYANNFAEVSCGIDCNLCNEPGLPSTDSCEDSGVADCGTDGTVGYFHNNDIFVNGTFEPGGKITIVGEVSTNYPIAYYVTGWQGGQKLNEFGCYQVPDDNHAAYHNYTFGLGNSGNAGFGTNTTISQDAVPGQYHIRATVSYNINCIAAGLGNGQNQDGNDLDGDFCEESSWGENDGINITLSPAVDTYELQMNDPVNGNPVLIREGENLTIGFNFLKNNLNTTSDVIIENATIGGIQADISGGWNELWYNGEWNLNVSAPLGLMGLQNLTLNATYTNDSINLETNESGAILYAGMNVPSIFLNAPENESIFVKDIFNISLNASVFDGDGDLLDVSIYGSNGTNSNIYDQLLYRGIGIQNESDVNYNWTALPVISDENTVLLLHLDKNGDVVNDSSDSGNNGTVLGPLFNFSGGKFAGGYEFDGVDDYIEVNYSRSLNITDEITIATWVKSNSEGYVVVKDPPSQAIIYAEDVNFGTAYFSSTNIKIDNWWVSDSDTYRGAAKFDLSSLPAQITVQSVELHANPQACLASHDLDIYHLANDPISATAPVLWSDARDGTAYVTNSDALDTNTGCVAGNYAIIDLGASAVLDLQNAIDSQGWFGVGISSDDTTNYAYFRGHTNVGFEPYIVVTYIEKSAVPFALSTLGGGEFLIKNETGEFKTSYVGDVNDGRWHHLAASYDGNVMRLYADGLLADIETAYSGKLPTNEFNVWIGRHYRGSATDSYFNGTIDEVAIWNRTLGSDEIKDLYRLKEGEYFWKANVNDPLGNSNESETRSFNVTGGGGGPQGLGVVLNSPDNKSAFYEGGFNISLNVTITGQGLLDVTLYGVNLTNGGFYQQGLLRRLLGQSGGSEIIYNWTSPRVIPTEASVFIMDLDENAGDKSGNGNEVEIFGAILNSDGGKIAGGYEFDGVDDYILVNKSQSLNITKNVTLSAWIKSNSEGYVIAKREPAPPIFEFEATKSLGTYASGTSPTNIYNGDWSNQLMYALMEFDVSPIIGKSVKKANLSVTTLTASGGGSLVSAYRINESWTEGGVPNSAGAPDYDLASQESNNTPNVAGQKYNFSVNSIVQGWLSGNEPNYGIVVTSPEASDGINNFNYFYSRTAAQNQRPNLIVEVERSGYGVPFSLNTENGGSFVIEKEGTRFETSYSGDVNDGRWHHLAASYDGNVMRLYVDGILVDSNSEYTGDLPINEEDVFVGRNYSGEGYFQGSMDEVSIWNRTFSSVEIKDLYRLKAGKYLLKANVTDVLGESNESDVRIINVLDNPNVAPEVSFVSNVSNVDPMQGDVSPVSVNFTVRDLDGVGDINEESIFVAFNRPGEPTRSNSSCTAISGEMTATSQNYNCLIYMQYYDADGDWNISVYAEDFEGEVAVNDTTSFVYNLLQEIAIADTPIVFNLDSGSENQTAISGSVVLNNTGNYEGPVYINGTNLDGSLVGGVLGVGNFTIGNETGEELPECGATQLVHGEIVEIQESYFYRGEEAQSELRFCIPKVPSNIPSQDYNGIWSIRIVSVIALLLRKKKKIKEDKLSMAVVLISEEMKVNYSVERKEILDLMLEELKKKFRVGKKQLVDILDLRKEENIPISIFRKKLGALESLVKYMKENLGRSYHEIALELGRDDRTIWSAYYKASKKFEGVFVIEEGEEVSLEIFGGKFTVLESLIKHLRDRRMKYVDIARLLQRDQRNVQTIYSRAVRKNG